MILQIFNNCEVIKLALKTLVQAAEITQMYKFFFQKVLKVIP